MGCDAAGPLATEVNVLLLGVARIESAHKHVERRSNVAPGKAGGLVLFRKTNQFLGTAFVRRWLFCEQINIAVEQLWGEIQGINTSRCAARL